MTPRLNVRWASALILLVLGAGIASLARAQTAGAKPVPEKENPEEFSRVPGLFDVDLPKTVEKYRPKVIVHPHFGDLLHRDYIRVPVGLRLGLNDRTEVNTEVESYLTHGLKKRGNGYGLDALHFGAKQQWGQWLNGADTSVGFNSTIPVGRPPLDLTDGHYHFAPYITFSKRFPQFPKLTPFASVESDLVWKSSVPGTFAKNEPHSHSIGGSAGYLYDLNTLKYTLVCSYATTALIGQGSKQFLSINPSILWQLPPALTFHSKSQWIFGIGVKAQFGPDGTDFGTSAKLRGEFRFMRFFRASPGQSDGK